MTFTAKVTSDGRFFTGSMDLQTHRDVHHLEPGKRYQGPVFDSMPTTTHYIEFNRSTIADSTAMS